MTLGGAVLYSESPYAWNNLSAWADLWNELSYIAITSATVSVSVTEVGGYIVVLAQRWKRRMEARDREREEELRKELRAEIDAELRKELRAEIDAELRAEISVERDAAWLEANPSLREMIESGQITPPPGSDDEN